MLGFSVTFEIVTEESSEDGEAAEGGFICQNVSLRDALSDFLNTHEANSGIQSIEASDSRHDHARWVTVYNNMAWDSGDFENRSLHFPESITPASRRRLVSLIKSGNYF